MRIEGQFKTGMSTLVHSCSHVRTKSNLLSLASVSSPLSLELVLISVVKLIISSLQLLRNLGTYCPVFGGMTARAVEMFAKLLIGISTGLFWYLYIYSSTQSLESKVNINRLDAVSMLGSN
jgi:chromate transport protein ChrA